ncbi:hypothetical protein [Propylenella binzhouense]|uniref:hypothetical protein n=1 Tax=Propylenella binzhouense TaxID=2555902 RepID=UPI001FE411AC|nr:hypothetical protein [Propylenella binzhouense]
MIHFRIPPSHRALPAGARPFLVGDSGIERVIVQTGKRVRLEIAGIAKSRTTLTTSVTPAGSLLISDLAPAGTKRGFALTAVRPGSSILAVTDGDGNGASVFVSVGDFKNHSGLDQDLIANVFRGTDLAKMHVLTRTLFNNWENLFNESSEGNQLHWCANYATKKQRCLPCGTVSKVGGSLIWTPVDYHYEHAYYEPIPQGKRNASLTRADIKYDSARLDQARQAIRKRLERGEPSVVGLVYIPSSAIRSDGSFNVTGSGGHSVLIVGCDSAAKTFLYIDVYPNGSKFHYKGGHAGQEHFPLCNFLGMFEVFDDGRGTPALRQQTASENFFSGASFLEVVSGPITH